MSVIETPKGSRNKFAFEEESYLFLLKKILPAGTALPLDFGCIPRTLAADGDPLDALVVMEQSSYPGCLIRCRPVGIIKGIQKKKGQTKAVRNDRIIAVPDASIDYARLRSINDLSEEHLNDLTHFFTYYNAMEGGTYKLMGTEGPREALAIIKESIV